MMMRQFFRCANACSQSARTDAISLLTCFFAGVSGLVLNAGTVHGHAGPTPRRVLRRTRRRSRQHPHL
jgi:hypothetical protein